MQVTLTRKNYGILGEESDRPEKYGVEMAPEEFAFAYATALWRNPSLNQDAAGQYTGDDAVFAVILGQDPARFKGRHIRQTEDPEISHEPSFVKMVMVCEGKLAQVTIGIRDSDRHYFFRISEIGLEYLPCAPNCTVGTTEQHQVVSALGFVTKKGDPAWPWIALYPEKFKGLVEFASILEPGDENPLTGLVRTKDAAVRTLAKQIVSKIERARDEWARAIVASL